MTLMIVMLTKTDTNKDTTRNTYNRSFHLMSKVLFHVVLFVLVISLKPLGFTNFCSSTCFWVREDQMAKLSPIAKTSSSKYLRLELKYSGESFICKISGKSRFVFFKYCKSNSYKSTQAQTPFF